MYSNKNKMICIISVVLSVVLCVSALGLVSGGFKNWDYKHWFDKKPVAELEPGGVVDGDGNQMESGKVYNMSKNMMFTAPSLQSAAATTGVNVKATLMPVDASAESVDWTVAFVNPASTWATGKIITNFVTVTPTADGSLTANIKCLEAFGEQIKITVKLRSSPTINTDCLVDYSKKIVSQSVTFDDGDGFINLNSTDISTETWFVRSPDMPICLVGGYERFEYTWSLGTIIPTNICSSLLIYNPFITTPGVVPTDLPAFVKLTETDLSGKFYLDDNLFKTFFGAENYDNPVIFNDIIRKLKISTNNSKCVMKFKVSTKINGVIVLEDIFSLNILMSAGVLVESVTIDNPTLVF